MAPCVFNIANYRIVYPEGEGELYGAALNVQRAIKAKSGMEISIVSDLSPKYSGKREILIGNTSREVGAADLSDKDVIFRELEDGSIAIIGASNYSVAVEADKFADSYVNEDGSLNTELRLTVDKAAERGTKIKVMSFNVLGWTADQTDVYVGDTYYDVLDCNEDRMLRAEAIASIIANEAPDSFGLQEFNIEWAKLADNGSRKWNYSGSTVYAPRLEKTVFANLPGYAAVGMANENPVFSYNPIFYRIDTWDCIEYGTKWLSPTPDVQFSEFESSAYDDQSRMVTYAVLKHKVTGETYVHYNTHLTIDRTILGKQIDALRDIIDATSNGRGYVLTGDMNINSTGWSEYDVIASYWNDARLCADASTDRAEKMIDYCLVSDGVYVESFKNMTEVKIKSEWKSGDETYYVSDHHPIYAEVYLY